MNDSLAPLPPEVESPPRFPMARAEFVALMAMLFATVAFSIDAMLPALPEIGAELSPDNLNRAQLILTAFVIGLGLGTFVTGPLSDTFGRKRVIIVGAAVYITGAAAAWAAQSLELMLAARLVQGLGAAGPRVVGMAVIRDLYSGRLMARLMSIVMMIFALVPAIAPLLGAGIIALSNWRGIFVAFVLFALIGAGWVGLRLEETLPRERRRPLRIRPILRALREILGHPMVRITIVVQTLCLAMLFATIASVQQIYDVTYDRAESFPWWFGGICLVSASASFVNAALVVRLGMRFLVTVMLVAQVLFSGVMVILSQLALSPDIGFVFFLIWQTTLFFQAGMTLGNLNAMGMEPLGHIAGTAASVIAGLATVLSMGLAMPIGLGFDGTFAPLAQGVFGLAVVALALMLWLRRIEQRSLP
ncbi:MFS transporter [Aquicoccus porphyridii]|uniref:MFS transporter n=1 Tax=Aquicoccus porphyridii TaxID=1852029 RepID=UPI00273D6E5D|nr:MFS transporter [Aquicoccus porphyridii]